jgi:hypothetical protein
MDAPTQDQIEEARTRLKDWARGAKSDPAAIERLRADPVGTLEAAGVPLFAVGDFMREEQIEPEVGAYATCKITCMCTYCCVTG